jgi:hypothetical protein
VIHKDLLERYQISVLFSVFVLRQNIFLLLLTLELIFKFSFKAYIFKVFIFANSVQPHHRYRPKHRRREGPPEVEVPESNLALHPKIMIKLKSSPDLEIKMKMSVLKVSQECIILYPISMIKMNIYFVVY